MGGISTSIGLISGIDTGTLIEQLIAIESRPKILATTRLTQLKAEQGAFLGFNSLLLSLKSSAEAFRKDKIFQSTSATSSNTSVLTASTNTKALPGSYQFLVNQLVSSSQQISTGFADSDQTALGGTEISFEFGKGRVKSDVSLSALNGGEGVARGKIQVTDSDGAEATIDLSTAVTLNDVVDAINTASGVDVSASIKDGALRITDQAGGAGELTIADAVGYTTATELGIAARDSDDGLSDGIISGSTIQYLSGNTALRHLNDGNGVAISSGLDIADFIIQTRDGTQHNIVLGSYTGGGGEEQPIVTSIQGVIDRISEITGGDVIAEIGADGRSLKLTDNSGGSSSPFEVQAGTNGDQTIKDLGLDVTPGTTTIDGSAVLADINSVLVKNLNGGSGLSGTTTLDITDRSGANTTIDVSGTTSLSDIMDLINDDGSVDVTATLNKSGTGLKITDNTGSTTSNLIITGDAAASLGIDTGVGGVDADETSGSNLQFSYVTASSLLSDLNYGQGVGTGTFRITDGNGASATVDIGSDARTLQDVISEINSRGIEVQARVNDTGDGLILESTAATPSVAIQVETVTGSTARDLNIVGEAAGIDPVDNVIDGSYERKVTLEATDTLDDLIQKINSEGLPVAATLINDGGDNPYRLSLSSKISGLDGDLIVETAGFDLGLTTLTKARDSVVFFGSDDPAEAILITGSSNTLDNVISGVSIDLVGTSDEVVQLTVSNDVQKMVDAVQSFVDDFNAVMKRIDSLDKYDSETEQRGILLGDPTLARVRSQLYRVIQGEAQGLETQFDRLVEVGITVGSGGLLEFDQERFREKYQEDPEAVQEVFSSYTPAESQDIELGEGISYESDTLIFDSLGVAEQIAQLMSGLTNSVDGTLTTVKQNYDRMIDSQEKRIEQFDKQLENRRIVLTRQFTAMESALATLQNQQAALASIQSIG